ncbi:aminotransferase class V-fold PLP-dependent enzyme [Devosia rhizoryzae]|uniref:Aminotransferase class V-fold PLP-dependent enzyme n=1 Tax=Devosia rhizoryzae TaxID=2774137 RepID=A0ABX7C985_9HYPH|nr:aminotransferase class V-fold PLP-dependent enzyme [Devosia rhizoryzae]QQR40771.1 aminotransferase class V-fold PLP-dependent enzyme [Devosia rhizoryzae]
MSGYFLYHSIGTFPGKAEAVTSALSDFAQVWSAEDDGQWPAALSQRQEFISAWERLIAAQPGTLTTTENVTSGLYSVIGALPENLLKGKRVLVAADCFPSLHFLLAGLAERFGFTLDTVPLRAGETWVREEDMLDRWQADVALALLTQVTSTTSHRSDLRKLLEHGRQMGSLVGIDITQGVGVVPFSVAELDPDFVVSTSLKWLCGTSGAGMLYVRPDLLEQCRPELRGWFSQPNPFSWDLNAFSYAPDARRFDHGTPAILASIASLPGLQWVEKTGVNAIAAQNRSMTETMVSWALGRGLRLASPEAPEQRGGSVMIVLPSGVVPSEIVGQLRSLKLFCDARGTTLRLSPGAVTGADDIARLCTELDRRIPA